MSFPVIKAAVDEAERERVQRFRYEIYVEQMGMFRADADHERRLFRDRGDDHALIVYAELDGQVVGTVRVHLGADAPFPEDFEEVYDLGRFRPVVGHAQMGVCTRFIVRPDLRGTPLTLQLLLEAARVQVARGVELSFLDCEPHLLNLYTRIGYRTYRSAVTHYAGAVVVVPLVIVSGDDAYMERVGSPLPSVLGTPLGTREIAARLVPLVEQGARAVVSAGQAPSEAYFGEVFGLLAADPARRDVFRGLAAEESRAVLAASHVLELARDGYLIRSGQTARSVFVVLEGTLEVIKQGRVVAAATPGDVIGEVAFLLESPRSGDVRVVSERARLLCLSEKTLRGLIESHSRAAALLLLNLSQALALKLAAGSVASDAGIGAPSSGP